MKITQSEMERLFSFGLIVIDKPQGPTSYKVSEYVKRQLGIKKTSHMGTLDPKVTGVLPITLGRACRLSEYLIHHDKTYVGILHTHREQEKEHLQELINTRFLGKITQMPPHKSAVKRQERIREVYSFTFLEESNDKRNFLFVCSVEGGTYIRKICSDLGALIGGAHMDELRRTKAGIFDETQSYTLHAFDEALKEYLKGDETLLRKMIIPAEKIISQVLPSVRVQKQVIVALHHGKPLFNRDIVFKEPKVENRDIFAVYYESQFIGVYKKTNEVKIFARPEFVYN